MTIIALGGPKGGPGKTTLATNLAVMTAQQCGPGEVLLVDADNNLQSVNFQIRRKSQEVSPFVVCQPMLGTGILKELKASQNKYKHIIIDCAGHDSVELRGAMMLADWLIIPVRPNTLDTDCFPKLNKLLLENLRFNKGMKTSILMSQVREEAKKEKREFVTDLAAPYPLLGPVMESMTTIRSTYEKCQASGMAVVEFAGVREKARGEMRNLYKEIWA